MEPNQSQDSRLKTIRTLRIAIASTAVALGLVVLFETNRQPRTDDAEVLANFIGIAPQVEGPIARLSVRDNQFVKKGELLFEIDDRPFRYALERAQSEQAALEGQIADDRRAIAAQQERRVRGEGQSQECRGGFAPLASHGRRCNSGCRQRRTGSKPVESGMGVRG